MYQPLAALGVLPLTGISWPGLGIDSPADLWLFVLGAVWCFLCDDDVRRRRARAPHRRGCDARRAIVLGGARRRGGRGGDRRRARRGERARRVATEDERIDAALRYAANDRVPVAGARRRHARRRRPGQRRRARARDDATARFDRELARGVTARSRALLVAALASCSAARAGGWIVRARRRSVRRDACALASRRLRIGPASGEPGAQTAGRRKPRGSCSVALSEELIAAMRAPVRRDARGADPRRRRGDGRFAATTSASRSPGRAIVRPAAGRRRSSSRRCQPGSTRRRAASVVAGDVALDLARHAARRDAARRRRAVRRRARPAAGVAPHDHGPDVLLDRVTLIAAGPPSTAAWRCFARRANGPASPPAVDHRCSPTTPARSAIAIAPGPYPYGAALPELGWVNPFDVERSLGLDGWIHAALARPGTAAPACGTLGARADPRAIGCALAEPRSDGVTECRVAAAAELGAASCTRSPEQITVGDPKPHTGRDVTPRPDRVRRAPARRHRRAARAGQCRPRPRAARLRAGRRRRGGGRSIKLRESRGEADAERVEWNLPIAVRGSTFKPIVARAAGQAFPQALPSLALTAAGHAAGCKAPSRRGGRSCCSAICPPSSLADAPAPARPADYLVRARSTGTRPRSASSGSAAERRVLRQGRAGIARRHRRQRSRELAGDARRCRSPIAKGVDHRRPQPRAHSALRRRCGRGSRRCSAARSACSATAGAARPPPSAPTSVRARALPTRRPRPRSALPRRALGPIRSISTRERSAVAGQRCRSVSTSSCCAARGVHAVGSRSRS